MGAPVVEQVFGRQNAFDSFAVLGARSLWPYLFRSFVCGLYAAHQDAESPRVHFQAAEPPS